MEMPEEVVTAQKAGKRMLFVGYSKETVSDENLPNLEIVASITLDDPLRKMQKKC